MILMLILVLNLFLLWFVMNADSLKFSFSTMYFSNKCSISPPFCGKIMQPNAFYFKSPTSYPRFLLSSLNCAIGSLKYSYLRNSRYTRNYFHHCYFMAVPPFLNGTIQGNFHSQNQDRCLIVTAQPKDLVLNFNVQHICSFHKD